MIHQLRLCCQEVLDRACSTSIESMLPKAQLRWIGHVITMTDDNRVPKQLLYGKLTQDSYKRGRPKLGCKSTVKDNLKWSSISPCELKVSATDRSAWKSHTLQAAAAFEEDQRQHLNAIRGSCQRVASALTL
uniref:Uncharacterized protein n=1 Tax=Octopus bimaculoides TaxID=37653 RepID=A0A0L8I6F7_OCTBM